MFIIIGTLSFSRSVHLFNNCRSVKKDVQQKLSSRQRLISRTQILYYLIYPKVNIQTNNVYGLQNILPTHYLK